MDDERLLLGLDYIIEDGKWVFLAGYLKRRGYCCQNGCRYCPYPISPQPESIPPADANPTKPCGHHRE